MRYLIIFLFSGLMFAGEGVAKYKVDGMMCAMNCPSKVIESVKGLDGVKNCKVDFETKTATVTFDNEKVDSDKIAKVMADATYYKVTPVDKESKKSGSWFSRLFNKS